MKFEPVAAKPGSADNSSPAPPDARFTLERPPFAGQAFDATLGVCANPCCPCGVVGFVCRSGTAPGQTVSFDLDVCRRELNTQVQSAPDGQALGRAFLAEAQTEQWAWLNDLFLSVKRARMASMDLNTLVVDFPADVKASGSLLLGYHQVFPWADTFRFTRDGEEWFVDDQYCVRPGCDCTEAGLSFYRQPAGCAPPAGPLHCVTFLHLDYATGAFGMVEAQPGTPAADVLVQAFRAANSSLPDTLRHRHGQLKQLGRRLMPKARHRTKSPFSYVGEDYLMLDEPSPSGPSAVAAPAPKAGRNDPCPCGSGKKFKKCCGTA